MQYIITVLLVGDRHKIELKARGFCEFSAA